MKKVGKKKRKKKIIILSFLFLCGIGLGIFAYFYFNGTTNLDLPRILELPLIQAPGAVYKPTVKIVNEESNTRPFAIMIDNNVGNNNHVGLLDAYLTYEIVVEGGLSRIMAVFKDRSTSLIGPVRSSRHYFLDYALENGAIYGHFGWSTFAQNDISSLRVNNINGMTNGGSAYWRDRTIAAPHNVFTSISSLQEQATKLGYSLTGNQGLLLKYSVDTIYLNEIESSTPANSVTVKYSQTQSRGYTYDADREMYLRIMNNRPHIDKESSEQLSYKNIIIERVQNVTLDSVGHQDLKNITTGDGYFLTEGYSVPIKWTKNSRSEKTKYTYLNGEELVMNDGRTFIQIIPTSQAITISE